MCQPSVMEESFVAELELEKPALGLRERGKQKRREAIKEAARAVFIERGYEVATTREIAQRAEVSLGTLFAYAPTKPELLVMIVNDDLDELTAQNLRDWAEDRPLLDMLVDFGTERYAYWAPQPQIGRYALREITAFMLGRPDPGPESVRFRDRVPTVIEGLAKVIERKQAAGLLRSTAPAQLIADLIWGIYNTEVKFWLENDKPDLAKGVARLRDLFAIAIEGLQVERSELGRQADETTWLSVPAKASASRKRVPK